MSRDKDLLNQIAVGHSGLTAGALLVRNLAGTMEQKAKVAPPVGPDMLRLIAEAMLDRLELLHEVVERLQTAPGGEA